MIDRRYDIYIVAEVDALKDECARLRAMWADVVAENALLNQELDKRRRQAVYGDDLEWTNERR